MLIHRLTDIVTKGRHFIFGKQPQAISEASPPHPFLFAEGERKQLLLERTIFQMNLQENFTLKEIADHLLTGIQQLFPGAVGSILLLRDGDILEHFSAPDLPAGYTDAINGVKAGPSVGSCGTAAATGKTVVVDDIDTDPLWKDYKDLAAKYNLRACWSVPIPHSKKKILGTFAIYHMHPKAPAQGMLQYIQRWAQIIGVLFEYRETLEELMQERLAHQQQIMRATIDMQEKAREEIAYELHDNVNQLLGAAKLYLETGKPGIPLEEQYRKESQTILQLAIDEIRRLSRSHTPPMLSEDGLTGAIESLMENLDKIHPFTIKFRHNITDEAIPDTRLQLAVYRIVQEQINNIIRYAQATQVNVELNLYAHILHITIRDNGVGFVPADTQKGVGFTNIINRSLVYKGKVFIESSPGQGCSLHVSLQLT